MKRPTIAMIAAATGVSPATVSRALRSDPRISAETTDRIRSKAAELDYASQPKAMAKAGAKAGPSGDSVGLVLGPMANPYFLWLLRQVLSEAAQRGKRVVLLHGQKDILEGAGRRALDRLGLEGCLITAAAASADMVRNLRACRIPAVLMDSAAPDTTTTVACDHGAGAARLADLILDSGYRRIALLRGRGPATSVRQRERGFLDRLEERSVPLHRRILVGRDERDVSTYAAGRLAAEVILAMPPAERPEVAFAVNDFMAIGAIDTFAEHGVRVPEDISIVGFDGIAEGQRHPYRLTTIRQPIEELVRTAFDCLYEDQSGHNGQTIMLRGELLIRSSLAIEPGQQPPR